MPRDLSLPYVRKQLAAEIKADIDAHCVRTYNDGFRSHLGASLIGDKCKRKQWYTFRWAKEVIFDARMYRIFNRGHREESRYIEYLTGIGFKVWTEDVNGVQYRLAACGEHFGGSIDGATRLPDKYDISEPLLLEFKTNNTGAHWSSLIKMGVAYEKPQHYIQMSIYGWYKQLRFALYINTNKNDDDMHIEIVELDWDLAQQQVQKAEQIILSKEPPPRLSENPTHWECKSLCEFHGICHLGEKLAHNCRSCKRATPVDGGQWHCDLHNAIIPKEILKQGCPHRIPIQ